MSDSPPPQLQAGAWVVQLWLTTGYNYDNDDLKIGGSRRLGPYMWVLESHIGPFMVKMIERYREHPQVLCIAKGSRKFMPMDALPSLEDQIREFEEHLAQPSSWPSQN